MSFRTATRHESVRRFLGYLAASGVALIVDYLAYLGFAFLLSIPLPIAAVFGYAIGLFVAYFLIAHRVMNDGWLRDRRHFEAILFFLSGILGMVMTYGTALMLLSLLGDRPHVIKVGAAGVSFLSVYLFRQWVVFRRKYA